jgi:hypothetical protein
VNRESRDISYVEVDLRDLGAHIPDISENGIINIY